MTILGTSGFNVNDINPATVTLDGVHAIAHITRKVRRDPFPMATYVFVADQLHLPKGLSNVTLTGTLNNGVTTFDSSTAVLNIPDAARLKGPLHNYMGNGAGLYGRLSKIEAKHQGVAINTPTSVALTRTANRAPEGAAKLKVSYTPVVHAAGKETATARQAPRPVVAIRSASSTSVVRMWQASCQPTIIRENTSMMNAKYSRPSQVLR